METLSIGIAVAAATLHGVAFIIYNHGVVKNANKPIAASWFVWRLLSAYGSYTYFRTTNDDWISTLQFFTGTAGCILTFVHVWTIGRFGPLTREDRGYLGIGVLAVLVRWLFVHADIANLIIMTAYAISFVPLYKKLWENPTEKPLPWMLWALAFSLTTLNAILRWEGNWVSIVSPTSLALEHFAVLLICSIQRAR